MNLKKCLFCQIIEGKSAAFRLIEQKFCLAILDAFPQTPGHILILNKRCVANLKYLNKQELLAIQQLSQEIVKLLETKMNAKGFNIVNNYNQIAGQIINHYHLHIIPRYDKATTTKNDLKTVWKLLK